MAASETVNVSSSRQACGNVLAVFILILIGVLAFSIRLFSVIKYESVIHEFDPYFNYRVTQAEEVDRGVQAVQVGGTAGSAGGLIFTNASHRVTVGALVVNHKKEVLVVQEKNGMLRGKGVWKFPTGTINEGEDICAAAVREVKEETGRTPHGIFRKVGSFLCMFAATLVLQHPSSGIRNWGSSGAMCHGGTIVMESPSTYLFVLQFIST